MNNICLFFTFNEIYLIDTWVPFYLHGLTLIPAWISNYMYNKVGDEITCTVEVWEWISNFTPQFIIDIITHPCLDLSLTMSVKGATGRRDLKKRIN